MREILFTLVGIVIGYLLAGKFINRQIASAMPRNDGMGSRSLNQEQTERKLKHLVQIVSAINAKGEITNDEVETMLDVSNTTAGRYLEELEQAGKITQVGRTGRSVKYARK